MSRRPTPPRFRLRGSRALKAHRRWELSGDELEVLRRLPGPEADYYESFLRGYHDDDHRDSPIDDPDYRRECSSRNTASARDAANPVLPRRPRDGSPRQPRLTHVSLDQPARISDDTDDAPDHHLDYLAGSGSPEDALIATIDARAAQARRAQAVAHGDDQAAALDEALWAYLVCQD